MTAEAAALMMQMGRKAKAAAIPLRHCPTQEKRDALTSAADFVRKDAGHILNANEADRQAAEAAGHSPAMLDRLLLTEERIEAMAASMEQVSRLPDPVGTVAKTWAQPNGLRFERIRIPIGVIGMIYESRPNVTAEAAALCLMSGNPVILRGGSEASRSNASVHGAIVAGLRETGFDTDVIQLAPSGDRAIVGAMLGATDWLDLLIPRGGKGLMSRVMSEARVPVLGHADGNCHVYVDRDADFEKAKTIVLNSKLRRTGVCGAAETLLIDQEALSLAAPLLRSLLDAGCEVRGDVAITEIDERIALAAEADWETEYLSPIIAAKVVEGVEGAVGHIQEYGSNHTDCIVTENEATATHFLERVGSAIVMHNASTQFADGGEFGFGAEIGIATGRVHARGPIALEELTTFKTVVRGNGQVRP